MRVIRILSFCAVCAMCSSYAVSARAYQSSNNDLARCLVSSTTPAQKTVLMQWMFAMLALHPSVAPMAHISDTQRDDLNRKMGSLVTQLLAVTCVKQARAAVQAGGASAIQSAFSVLGRTAAMGLMRNPKVVAGLGAIGKYVDKQKLKQAFGGTQ